MAKARGQPKGPASSCYDFAVDQVIGFFRKDGWDPGLVGLTICARVCATLENGPSKWTPTTCPCLLATRQGTETASSSITRSKASGTATMAEGSNSSWAPVSLMFRTRHGRVECLSLKAIMPPFRTRRRWAMRRSLSADCSDIVSCHKRTFPYRALHSFTSRK